MKTFLFLGLSLALSTVVACSSDEASDDITPAAGSAGKATAGAAGKGGAAGAAGGSAGGTSGAAGEGGSAGTAGAGAGMSGSSGQGGAGEGGGAGAGGEGGAGNGGQGGAGNAGPAGAGGDAGGAGAAGVGGSAAGEGGAGGDAGSAGAGNAGAAGDGGSAGQAGGGGAAGAGGGCVPTTTQETECNGLDDDCNGKIDDVDAGSDGICDCLRIGIVGLPGSNPSSNFQAWLEGFGSSVERVNKDSSESFDAALLEKFDVTIIDRLTRPYTEVEAATFASWIGKGKGFISLTGYSGAAAPDFYPNVLLAPFGLQYQGGLSSAVADQFVPHPTTEGVTSVTFLGGYTIQSTPGAGVTNTLIASNSAGPVGYATELGKGRGVAWGDEWIEFDSEWQKLPQIQKFWVNMVSWVGPQDYCVVGKP